jgi:hypothetical protein
MIVAGVRLVDEIQKRVDNASLWRRSEDDLQTSVALCDQWLLSVELLTGQLWKRGGQWKGDPVSLVYLLGFKHRLEQVGSDS